MHNKTYYFSQIRSAQCMDHPVMRSVLELASRSLLAEVHRIPGVDYPIKANNLRKSAMGITHNKENK